MSCGCPPSPRSYAVRDEVLLTLRADNGEWAPVTGILDPGEEPAIGAAREALEETGVVVTVDRLVSVSASPQVVHGNGDLGVYLDLTFDCTWVSGEARVADDENTDVRWWPTRRAAADGGLVARADRRRPRG